MSSPLVEAMRRSDGGASGGTASLGVLPGAAQWAAGHVGGGSDAVVLVAGIEPRPIGAIEVGGPTALVIAAAPDLAFVAVGDGDRIAWSPDLGAVRAVVEAIDLPPGAGAVVEQALARAPEAGGLPVGPVLAALEAVIGAERRGIATRLHDGPVQELTAAQLLLDSALWADGLPDAVRGTLERGLAALGMAMESCRRLMGELAGRDA